MTKHSLFACVILAGTVSQTMGGHAAAAEDLQKFTRMLQPHKAIYALSIDTVKPDGGVADADGAIFYEFRETCKAWHVRHRFKLRITRSEKPAAVTLFDFTSVEAKDGKRLSFSSVTTTNGKVTGKKSGVATLGTVGGPGRVALKEPKAINVKLPPGTLFPTWHTLKVIRAGEKKVPMVWANIFDGSDDAGRHNGINVVILGKRPAPGTEITERLLRRPGWMMTVSYYAPDKGDGAPTYSLRLRLNDNGITSDMVLDYGDFTMKSELKAIEPLKKPKC